MSLAQQLLLRALVARFWQQPYRRPLVRWGTELHDRFMLPHFVAQDFDDVLDELQRRRLSVRARVVRAALRVPLPARRRASTAAGIALELRQAIEPWHVLGEEASAGGTARYVDSSVERLQVKVQRPDRPDRYVVACNGRRVPLHPTGTNGEFVAGVRYRAWQPPIGAAPDDRRARAAGLRRRRHLDRASRSAAAPTTSRTRAAAPTTICRATRSRRRAGAARASSRSATRRARCPRPSGNRRRARRRASR